jgi:hypothetical protein
MKTAFPKRKGALLPLELEALLDMSEEDRLKKEKRDAEMVE